VPATPSQFKRPRVVRHTINFEGAAEVVFTYDANKLRDSWLEAWAAEEAQSNTGKLNEMLDDLIIGWDLINEDGTPYPKTAATIADVFTLPDKSLICEELLSAQKMTEAEKRGSSEPLASQPTTSTPPSTSSTESAPTLSNGSQTSESLPASASPSVT
jgi:hypothetical protein